MLMLDWMNCNMLLLNFHYILITSSYTAGYLNTDLLSATTITAAYSDFLCDYNLPQQIVEPSTVTTTSATLIGHIITTPNIKVNSKHQSIDLSDHLQ